jgi:DNA mismatch repair ATPase MutL
MESPASRGITPLARPVHSRLRSAVIIPTFSQILNESIQNSLDAGATRIECWISLERGNETIRVEDNGHGFDRDSLHFIGGDSGTSTIPRLAMQAEPQRLAKTVQILNAGQLILMASEEKVCNITVQELTAALASISSLGLLEITSKTARSRHTHTKVIKVNHILLPTVLY